MSELSFIVIVGRLEAFGEYESEMCEYTRAAGYAGINRVRDGGRTAIDNGLTDRGRPRSLWPHFRYSIS